MKFKIYLVFLFSFIYQFSSAQDITLNGTIWIDYDTNNQYDGEDGISNVKVYLINADTDELFDSTLTINADFNFPSSSSIDIPPGMYYLEIAMEEFVIDGNLQNIESCLGFNDADDGVDNDDNGMDMIPMQTTHFSLNSGLVEHIDFCLFVPCQEANVFALNSCDEISEAEVICDISTLGTFCNLMPSGISPGSQPNPLCPDGGAPENLSWFAFIAFDGNYSIVISPSNCQGSTMEIEGIQAGIYTDCTYSESVFCNANCSINPITIPSDVLIPGQTYYLFIDGCANSVCSYSINIEGAPLPPNIDVTDVCIIENGSLICEDVEYEPNEEITFIADGFDLKTDYTWSITTLSGGPFEGDPSPTTDENTIELDFNNEGIYEVCLTNVSLGCPAYDWNGQECMTVIINELVNTQDTEYQSLNIIPNPANEYITIDGELPKSAESFLIYSIEGKEVQSGKINASERINISELVGGLYVIAVIDSNGQIAFVERFIKRE